MSDKWSAFPAATEMANADIMAIVQGGVNKKLTRTAFFVSAAGEEIALQTPGGTYLGALSTGQVNLQPDNGQQIAMFTVIGGGIVIDPVGAISIMSPAGPNVAIASNGALIDLQGSGAIAITPAGGQLVTIGYTAAIPAQWVAGVTELRNAVDRLAAALILRTGGAPIP